MSSETREWVPSGCRVPLALPATAVALTENKISQFEACGVTVGDRPLCVPIFTTLDTPVTLARARARARLLTGSNLLTS